MTRGMDAERVSVTSVQFRRYKGLRDFSVALEDFNLLVGPNNSGKSTIIGAFRMLSVALARARSRRPERVLVGDRYRPGYRIAEDSLPVSLENVHTDYADVETTIRFRLSNGLSLALEFPATGDCFLLPDPEGPVITGPAQFRTVYPLEIGVVPVLGSLEHDEPLVSMETVRRGLVTHLASRHFRSYWYHFPANFEAFRLLLRNTWDDVDIQPSEIAGGAGERLAMFCIERRMTRELYWAGFGFQVWCQILSHLVRMQEVSLLVIDEPEIYLHPDLQRRLVSLLRDLGPRVLIATHSSEIVGEVEPTDIVLVDKERASAKRVSSQVGVQAAFKALGSSQNVVLAQLARTRRVLFVEGDDFKMLRRVASRLGLPRVANGIGLVPVPLGGFPDPGAVRALASGMEMAVGEKVVFAGVFDRDFRTEDEVEEVEEKLGSTLAYCHIYGRKEIENFLLVPAVIQRALDLSLRDRARRLGLPAPAANAESILAVVSETLRMETQANVLAAAGRRRAGDGRDAVTINLEVSRSFEAKWGALDIRLGLASGKRILALLNTSLQRDFQVHLSARSIIDAFKVAEIPFELSTVVRELEHFAIADPDRKGS